MYRFNKVTLKTEGTLKKVSGTKYFRVFTDYEFELYKNEVYIATIFIPKGFLTDFGSIPSIFFSMDKTRYITYILHDYLYSLLGTVQFIDIIRCVSRREADFVLKLGLKSEGMTKIGRIIVDTGLLIGGPYNYKVHKSEIKDIISTFK